MSFERSYLFVAGTDRQGILDAAHSVTDVVIVDLEDTVLPSRKGTARETTRKASSRATAQSGSRSARRALSKARRERARATTPTSPLTSDSTPRTRRGRSPPGVSSAVSRRSP